MAYYGAPVAIIPANLVLVRVSGLLWLIIGKLELGSFVILAFPRWRSSFDGCPGRPAPLREQSSVLALSL
jgi:hypothetical protein